MKKAVVRKQERGENVQAVQRVKDHANHAIGFIINDEFYPDYYVETDKNIAENLIITKDGIIETETALPEITYAEAVNKRKYHQLIEENPFDRDIQSDLSDWKDSAAHKVLQLEGTRQVGKTTELLKFAYKNYEYVIYVNIANDKYNFLKVLGTPRMVHEMEYYCQRALLPQFVNDKNTVLIIDEIQNDPKVYNSIRDLYAEFKCDIIVTGSYLGRILGNKEFFLPAGTIHHVKMFTLSFREFCRIYQKEELLADIDLYGGSAEGEYEELDRLYLLYRQIGGYPEVIKSFIQTSDIGKCYEVIEDLLRIFKEESRNYFHSKREVEIFDHVYREALEEMCNEKKGTGSSMIKTITNLAKQNTDLMVNKNEVANAIIWLIYAGIIGMCDLAVDGSLNHTASGRRIYFSDCGLAAYLASRSTLDKTALTGLETETFVYNELHRLYEVPYSKRLVKGDNVCFSIYEKYELDFMLMSNDRTIYGIEVKTAGGDPVSLKVFISRQFVDKGVLAKQTHGGRGRDFDTIPIYTVGCRFPYDETCNMKIYKE